MHINIYCYFCKTTLNIKIMKKKKLNFKIIRIENRENKPLFDIKLKPMSCCCMGCSGDLCGTK